MSAKKVILITGASSGIGKSCAIYLSKKGHVVYGTSRKREQQKADTHFQFLQLDVTDATSVAHAVKAITDKEGRLDVLINNAGVGLLGAVEDTTIEETKKVFETNFFGAMQMCQAVLPTMRKQQAGYIINIGSLAGLMGLPFRSSYSSSKFALEGFTEALRMEVSPFGIKVVMVEPSYVKTEMNKNRTTAEKAMSSTVYKANFDIVSKMIHEELDNGCSPDILAKQIEQILHASSPRVRYTAGLMMQKVIVKLKKMLPSRTFEKLLKQHYKLK